MGPQKINENLWSEQIEAYKKRILRLREIIEEVAEEEILPLLSRNYDASGLKTHRGLVKQAISKRGAAGNIFKTEQVGDAIRFTAGVDKNTQVGLEAYWAVEGNAPSGSGDRIYPKHKKFLFFNLDGKPIFAKSVKVAPAHPTVYSVSQGEEEAFRQSVYKRVTAEGLEL